MVCGSRRGREVSCKFMTIGAFQIIYCPFISGAVKGRSDTTTKFIAAIHVKTVKYLTWKMCQRMSLIDY